MAQTRTSELEEELATLEQSRKKLSDELAAVQYDIAKKEEQLRQRANTAPAFLGRPPLGKLPTFAPPIVSEPLVLKK